MSKGRRVAIRVSLLLFVVCLFCDPFYSGGDHVASSSLGLLMVGWLGVGYGYYSWFANPAYIVALIARKRPYVSTTFSLLAAGLSLVFLSQDQIIMNEAGTSSPIVELGAGYMLWVSAFFTFASWNVLAVVHLVLRERTEEEKLVKRFEKDFASLSDEELSQIPLYELQRIRNKRWAFGRKDLAEQAQQELYRRDPRNKWACTRCKCENFHEKQIRVAGSLAMSWLNIESEKFHAIVCNYCGKAELYSVLMDGSKAMDFLAG